MADDEFAPDEWDPPRLNDHMPFPPPVGLDLDVFDTFPPFVVSLFVLLWFRAYHDLAPWWYWWAWGGGIVLWTLNAGIRPEGRRLLAWIVPLWRYVRVAITSLRAQGASKAVHTDGGWTFVLPPSAGQKLLANVVIDDDGVINTVATRRDWRIVRWLKWLIAVALLQEPLVRQLWLSTNGEMGLVDAEGREGIWAARGELLNRPEHRMSLYVRVRAFPAQEILVASGPLGTNPPPDLLAWIQTLVQRRLLLTVPAATRKVLRRRLVDLLGLEGQDGKLAQAGVDGRVLTVEEARQLADEAWGPDHAPTLAVSPKRLEIETGADDPPPVQDLADEPQGGNPGVRSHRTYVVTALLDLIGVGWMDPLTNKRIHCDVGMHIEPIRDSWADSVLSLKRMWWMRLSMGAEKYALAVTQAARTMNMIRRRKTSAIRFGLYVSVPDTQAPQAELALKEMVGRHHYKVPSFESIQARMATEPFGRDPLNQRWWTDSQTVAAAWPGTGGIWVPGCTLMGESIYSNEPVGLNLWWEGDEAPILFVAGRSGSGKTNLEMGFIGRHLQPHPDHWLSEHPPQTIIAYVKPWDEWAPFCRRFGGKHYRLTTDNWRAALSDAPIDGAVVAFNMRGISADKRGDFLDALESWVTLHQKGKRKKYPLIYVVGEAWAMKPGHLQQLALQDARALQIGLVVDTQYVDHLLRSDARDVIRSCASFALMRLHKGERAILQEMFDIGDEGMVFLRQIAQPNTLTGGVQVVKGRCIFEAHGLRTRMQFKRFGFERALLDQTNPRLVDDELLGDDDDELDVDEDDADVAVSNGVVHA